MDKKALKQRFVSFICTLAVGAALPIFGALYAGGEAVAQAGLRLAAIESGFALASRHWQFEAVPEHQPDAVATAETWNTPAGKPLKKQAKR